MNTPPPGVAAAFPDVMTYLLTYLLTYESSNDGILTRHRRLIFLVIGENSPDYF